MKAQVFGTLAIVVHTITASAEVAAPGGTSWILKLPPKDNTLYRELETAYDADTAELRKAYYRLALELHPDKEGGDAERFKRVSDAYQILQDTATRLAYHSYGLAAVDIDYMTTEHAEEDLQVTVSQPQEIFRLYLGGGQFDSIIGNLSSLTPKIRKQASVADQSLLRRVLGTPEADFDLTEKCEAASEARAKILADVLLHNMLPYLTGDVEAFDAAIWAEGLSLREESLGAEILSTVAYVYMNYGQRTLGKLADHPLQKSSLTGRLEFYSERTKSLLNLVTAAASSSGLILRLRLHYGQAKVKRKDATLESLQASPGSDAAAIAMIGQTLWKVHRVGVEGRVRRACKLVLRDRELSPAEQAQRAQALIYEMCAKGMQPHPVEKHTHGRYL